MKQRATRIIGAIIFTLEILLMATAFLHSPLFSQTIVRIKETSDATLRTTETSFTLTQRIKDTSLFDSFNTRLAQLESELAATKAELAAAKEWQNRYNDAIGGKFAVQQSAIAEAAAHKFGFVLQMSRLISNHSPRQHYQVGISYALSPMLRIEGSVLAGGAYENQNSDLGGKLLVRYRYEDWEFGLGGVYRAAGRRDGNLEDNKYLAVSPIVRYHLGVPYIEIGYAYEWLLNWHREPELFTQSWNENRLSVGIGIAFE